MNRTKTTEAFEKYIDVIFIYQNSLMNLAPKKFCERFDSYEYSLETYDDELWLRAGMCVKLAKKIEKHLKFENTYSLYKNKMMSVASNFDLDNVEVDRISKRFDKTLFAHAKLEYCFENYLNEISLNNNISILTYLMAIYAKVVKIKKAKNPNENVENITLTKWYRYVRNAMLEEEAVDIKDISKFSLEELSEKLFNLIVYCQYFLTNTTQETMLSTEGENVVIELFVIEENNDYQEYKQEFERKVYDWMVERIHHDKKLQS